MIMNSSQIISSSVFGKLIANASYLGSYGNAANTVVFPLTVIALYAKLPTVGRGSFVSAQNKELYQEEQQRIAEEHLQAAAEIGRVSNISLEKLTELLEMFYREEE